MVFLKQVDRTDHLVANAPMGVPASFLYAGDPIKRNPFPSEEYK